MKYSLTLVAVGAALAAAQSLTDLPQCGQTCINNMLALAPSLGCPNADAACLCNKADFGYGIRDCSTAVCLGDTAAVQSAISYGVGYCVSALSGSATASGAVPALTGTAAAGGSGNSTATTTTGAGSSSAITTAPLTTGVTASDTTFVTTTGETTIYGAAGGVGGGSGSSTTAPSGSESSSGAGAGASSTSSEGSESATTSSSSGAGGAGASSTSSTSTGGVAVMTAAPLLGMAALAVLAL